MSKLRPRLKVGDRALFYILPNLLYVLLGANRHKPARALFGIKIKRLFKEMGVFDMQCFIFARQYLLVVKHDFVRCRIVQRTHKLRRCRDRQPSHLKQFPYWLIICHIGKDTSIHQARSSAAGTAVMRAVMRVIGAA
ncbi:hypothetical protein D3C72_1126570 [compost metagenome]